MKKTKLKMNKPVYVGMSILDISKTLVKPLCIILPQMSGYLYKFWYDYIKPKYEDRAKLCYTDTG